MKTGYKNTSAPENLFKILCNEDDLSDAWRDEYHTIITKTLWLSQ